MSNPDSASLAFTEPAIAGPLRDCSPTGKGRARLREGDIAVIDTASVVKNDAQFLIDAKPAAVINAQSFISEDIPTYGALMLIEAGIPLYQNAGVEVFSQFRDGAKKGSVTAAGSVLLGKKVIANAQPVSPIEVEAAYQEAQLSLLDTMEAFAGNSVAFVRSEAPLLIDGIGIPDLGDSIQDKKVLVVSPGIGHQEQIQQLRNFIREYEPVLIGVEAAADSLVEAGYKPDLIVGDPALVKEATLRSDARVILPADPDGHATGLERIQDLGVGAQTFPAATDSATDLALLMADYHGAEMIVLSGAPLEVDDVFARRPQATPATALTRFKVGPKLVDASAVINMYTVSSGRGMAWLWALLGLLVAIAAIILVVGFGGPAPFGENLVNTWNGIATTVQGCFS